MPRAVTLLLIIAALVAPGAAHAQSLTGTAAAVDGDTLAMEGTRIRLHGIDAVESAQTCQRAGATWNCGAEAAARLRQLVQGKQITCTGHDTDRYGRLVAACRAGQIDLAAVMVQSGLAVALPQYSDAYLEAEARAQDHRIGIWGAQFEMPSAYRAAHPRPNPGPRQAVGRPADRPASRGQSSASGNCVIKGNRNRKGEWIYHVPGMPYYNATRPEELFCTEAQAVAAGYRRAIVRP